MNGSKVSVYGCQERKELSLELRVVLLSTLLRLQRYRFARMFQTGEEGKVPGD